MPVVPIWGYDATGEWAMLNRAEWEPWKAKRDLAAAQAKAINSDRRRGWLYAASDERKKSVNRKISVDR